MKATAVLVLLAARCCVASDVTPVMKVVELLKDMTAKGKKEMQDEQVQFAAYKQFCEDTAVEKQRAIGEGKDAIEVLDASIQKNAADADRLASEITGHMSTIESATAEKEAAAKVRASERADFGTALKDYTESIDAVGRALRELKQKPPKAEEGALVQLKALQLPEKASRGLHALLSEGYGLKENALDSLDDLMPTASTYDFQSGGVIDMLSKLQDKFVDERAKLEKEELQKKHSFELMQKSLENQVTQAKKEQQDKSAFKAKKLQAKAGAESEMTEAQAGLKVDESYAQDLAATCAHKASDFEERQKVRGEELEAIQKATDIISSDKVSLLQRGTALAMLRAEQRSPVQAQVAKFLQQAGERLNSRVLTSLSERAAADPMGKVRQMIEQLIIRLQGQANAETTKKGWCDSELATNKATREEKTDAVDTITAEMDELKASIAKLGEDVKTLSSELSKLNEDMTKATELRQAESHENQVTVKDAKEAQMAVARAMVVLKDFYAKAGEASFLQTAEKSKLKGPAIFGDEPYQGMGDSTGGVLGLLEVIEADFARLQADTSAAEASASKEHDSFMQDSKITKAEKSKEVEHKTARKQDKSSELINLEADLHGSEKELDAAAAYFEKLKSDCLDAGSSYDERKQRREQEIADLQEAMTMLSAE